MGGECPGRVYGDTSELSFASSAAHHSQHLWSQALQVLLVAGRDRLILTVTTEGEEGVEGEAARALRNGDTVMLVHALTGAMIPRGSSPQQWGQLLSALRHELSSCCLFKPGCGGARL